MDFAVPVDLRAKMKENKKIKISLNLAREQRNLLNMKVTIIPTVDDPLRTVRKGLEKKTRNKWKTEEGSRL